ncbi:hypothetical protein MMC10_011050 [Thelotrema lepadinum]|nr:hypothetical protein [Thelotrema lepadinum]
MLNKMMEDLRLHTKIKSRYRVFDASGQLPFSIVFGLCRRSTADTEPRPLLLEIAGSALDVSYALAHGLLTLQEQDTKDEGKQWVEVDLSRLKNVAAKEAECLSLPSSVNRKEHWRDAFTVYQCHFDVEGELASMLKPGKRYRIRLASEDLGVKRWAYSDGKGFDDNDGKLSHDSQAVKLVNIKPTGGNATFKVVKSLPWPPKTEIRMRLCASSLSSDSVLANTGRSSSTAVEISVVNTGTESVTVQTRGHQNFLIPWGPFQPEPDVINDSVRVIDATSQIPPTAVLQVIDYTTGEVVGGNKQHSGCCGLTSGNIDQRPMAKYAVTLKPGVPVIRKIDIEALMNGLEDGHHQYKIRMQSAGCRWWHGEVSEEQAEDGRVPARLGCVLIPPLILESQDEVFPFIR